MKIKFTWLVVCLCLILTGCGFVAPGGNKGPGPELQHPQNQWPTQGPSATLGGDDESFGEDIKDTGIYDGFFEEETLEVNVQCLSGTPNAYKVEGSVLTFTPVAENTAYSISGEFKGSIVIDAGDEYRFELELQGLSMISEHSNPITVVSGDEVTIKAKKDTDNYIYDMRPAAEENAYAGAIHSKVDLQISGKGKLSLVSENNNGIHSKDDLQVKNLTLSVVCLDNALKGNDSVQIENATTTLIASKGDCIKTTNSDISDKGNQRGSITIHGGAHTLYAACDGIDAAYNAVIEENTTVLTIYTDKYSNYSQEVTDNNGEQFYIRYTSQKYNYSVKYSNFSTGESEWVDAQYHSKVAGGRSTYYYYAFPKKAQYDKLQVFVYTSGMPQQQTENYYAASEIMTVSTSYDTIAYATSRFSWTNYTTSTQPGGGFGGPGGGMGGMMDGNTDKGDHSTKGIQAGNEVVIHGGTISIKAYDDAIHASNGNTMENGVAALGNVTVLGGDITVYSNDDGLHADGILSVQAGIICVTNAYEGLEGTQVQISGGSISINSKDDGINATTSTGTAISISGGDIYIYCTGDGIDSNSRTANVGIVFTGGRTVVISNSGMNSALDTENGYTYTAGWVVAIMPQGGMSSETTHCSNFNTVGKSNKSSLTAGQYLTLDMGGAAVTIRMPVSLSALIVNLGSNNPVLKTVSSTDAVLDRNGVCWKEN